MFAADVGRNAWPLNHRNTEYFFLSFSVPQWLFESWLATKEHKMTRKNECLRHYLLATNGTNVTNEINWKQIGCLRQFFACGKRIGHWSTEYFFFSVPACPVGRFQCLSDYLKVDWPRKNTKWHERMNAFGSFLPAAKGLATEAQNIFSYLCLPVR